MVLETIYVTRHGSRTNWTVDPWTGKYSSNGPTPTGIPTDPQLTSYGVAQASQLADKVVTLDPLPDFVYSSPFYRCLQTIAPSYHRLSRKRGTARGIRADHGIGEFFGQAWFDHPAPASTEQLDKHFGVIDTAHAASIKPNIRGESLEAIHARTAYAMQEIIRDMDNDPQQPRAVLICTHAATMICIGRVLSGLMPDDPNQEDFRCPTCSLSTFNRRKPLNPLPASDQTTGRWEESRPADVPPVQWKGSVGVAGGWDCLSDGDCSFLENGEDRNWHFQGDESFMHIGARSNTTQDGSDPSTGKQRSNETKL